MVQVCDSQPAIVLVRPQLGENIGMAARAMLNFGLTDMRLVSPRDGWPNPSAGPAASGADVVLDKATVFDRVEDAIADCNLVFATTMRGRDMPKPVMTPREAARRMRSSLTNGQKPAILFGPERSGLTNDDVTLADSVLSVPVNPDFGSLNLAQTVVVTAYEYAQSYDATPSVRPAHEEGLAPKEDLIGLMQHLEDELAARGFFRSEDRYGAQRRMLRNLLQSGSFSAQEVRTFRGIVKALTRPERDGGKDRF